MNAVRPSARWRATAADISQARKLLVPVARTRPTRDEVVERPERLLDRRGAVGPVELVEVDAVGAEAAEARFARGDDVVVRQRAGPPRPEADLGGDEHVVAPVADRGAEDLLRLPERVHVGGVDQVHAGVEGTVDHQRGRRARRRW